MEKMDSHLQFWLSTTFQNIIQVSLQLSKNPAPEETPYVYKYQAITMLKKLLEKAHPYHFIVHIILGQIYSDVDQLSDSVRSYEEALVGMSSLQPSQAAKFANSLIVLYNMLGLSYVNRQQIPEGIGCLAKAMQIYYETIKQKHPIVYHNRSQYSNGEFRCYYEGGVNTDELQDSHTLTLFYLAQCYTKLGSKDRAAQYCGLTIQRQHATGRYQINDFCHNLIGLAEYYEGYNYFAQALYLLMLAFEVLPQGRKKKMRAKLQIALGAFQSKLLQHSVENIRNNKNAQNLQKQNQKANKKCLTFQNFKQAFPKVSLAKDLQQCKSLFRKANTQYKKALTVFVLDGFVTEHIDILFAISKLYLNLCKLDKSREKVCAMLEKRKQLLEPLLTELNPKAFPATWQKVLVQTSQIYNDLFQLRSLIAIDVKQGKPISEQKLNICIKLGKKLIQYYTMIIAELENDKDAEKNAQYYRSIINSKFNIAKTLSKMMSNDVKVRVEFLKQSWQKYKQVADFIKNKAQPKEEFAKQLELTNEMIAMLPNKIDRINYKQVSPFQ